MAYWLFQGNPKYYRVLEAIKELEAIPWLVTRYANDIAPGDGVIIWLSGSQGGIYATAEVIEPAQFLTEIPDKKYWVDSTRALGKQQAIIRFTNKFVESPLLKNQLQEDSVLKNLLVLRAPNSTNFKVSSEEWEQVQKLIQEK
ncbi:EVE domain-containing protein [Anabaena sp. FACHB-1250]|uniref:EVE domain-containing protein n=1 Tax=Dolichospermum flos-aquae LEGE 04289 TaxID=1828708 RepID=A0ACC5Q1V2_DOLFA|nr:MULTISPECIES: EVE domain-containing protein [Nostocales]MBD2141810.1 EVE domain-containing protein [Anabaena sp. FACHB-1250]MBE9218894.1 EVE domain-containing protein [Dolichospermum flos-aquae LEGE 04289]